MAATQFEINYENALKAKNDAQAVYNKANTDYINNKKFTNDAKVKFAQCSICEIGGVNFRYKHNEISCATIKAQISPENAQGLFSTVWSTQHHQKDCDQWNNDYATAAGKEEGLLATVEIARAAYQVAEIAAKKAYEDWLEWKKSNMSASDLAEYLELEQAGEAFGLKLDTWKWVGIGIGSLAFLFGVWWILRRFKVKLPDIGTVAS